MRLTRNGIQPEVHFVQQEVFFNYFSTCEYRCLQRPEVLGPPGVTDGYELPDEVRSSGRAVHVLRL